MNNRINNFMLFLQKNDLEGGVSWFKGEYHVSISEFGNVVAASQNKDINIALNEVFSDLTRHQ